jgi:hypothetical protein
LQPFHTELQLQPKATFQELTEQKKCCWFTELVKQYHISVTYVFNSVSRAFQWAVLPLGIEFKATHLFQFYYKENTYFFHNIKTMSKEHEISRELLH